MYLDTSVWVRLCLPEADSEQCEAIAATASGFVSSELLIGELTSALLAKERNRLITSSHREIILAKFDEQIADGTLQLLPLNSLIVREATEVMRLVHPQVSLRTLDALHLATYLSVEAGPLFTKDRRMLDAARRLNIPLAGA